MARYIEFVGVSGIGKTSTYLTLRAGKKEDSWILYEELFGNGKSRHWGIKRRLEILLHLILNPRALPQVERDPVLLQRFVENNPKLVNFHWENQTERNDGYKKDLRFYYTNYISGIFEKVQNINESSCTKFCLLDEGLIHNITGFFKGTSEKGDCDEVAEILDLIQMPSAVVYFNGELETIIKRTFDRGNLRPKDLNLTCTEIVTSRRKLLKMQKSTIRAIKARKVPVLVVQAQDSLKEKGDQIKSFLSSLDHQ